jgi:hypothetical protein
MDLFITQMMNPLKIFIANFQQIFLKHHGQTDQRNTISNNIQKKKKNHAPLTYSLTDGLFSTIHIVPKTYKTIMTKRGEKSSLSLVWEKNIFRMYTDSWL